MAGNKNSGAPGVSRKAGPGRMPQKFTLKIGCQYLVSEVTPDGGFLPLRLLTVTEVNRKLIRLVDKETGNEVVLSR